MNAGHVVGLLEDPRHAIDGEPMDLTAFVAEGRLFDLDHEHDPDFDPDPDFDFDLD
jgi:hypothetical protein